MNENNIRLEPPELDCYDENRALFPMDELMKYSGLFVAFSADGTRIVASGSCPEELDQALTVAGIHLSQVVHSFIDS